MPGGLQPHEPEQRWRLASSSLGTDGTEVELAATTEPRAAWASYLASCAEWDVYVPERAIDDTLLPEDDYALDLGDPDRILGETGGEETGCSVDVYANAEEVDIGATIGVDGTSTSKRHLHFSHLS
ncbi:hypothetical protein D1007_44869 [Hordeum vulgare]|nr:hypothetical protein D1007_44869 [Hordeum vulgare]